MICSVGRGIFFEFSELGSCVLGKVVTGIAGLALVVILIVFEREQTVQGASSAFEI